MTNNDKGTYKMVITIFSIVLLFLFFALAMITIPTIKSIKHDLIKDSFLPIKANIIKCYVIEEFTRDKDKSQQQFNRASRGFYPRIIVQYKINNKEFTADSRLISIQSRHIQDVLDYLKTIAPGQPIIYEQYRTRYLDQSIAKYLQEYPIVSDSKSSEIEIYYNPEKPEQISLALEKTNYWIAVLIVSLISIPLIFLLRSSFIRAGVPLLFIPITGTLLVSAFASANYMLNNFKTGFEKGKPYLSIDIIDKNTIDFKKYFDPNLEEESF
jgi:hypothetical protein